MPLLCDPIPPYSMPSMPIPAFTLSQSRINSVHFEYCYIPSQPSINPCQVYTRMSFWFEMLEYPTELLTFESLMGLGNH